MLTRIGSLARQLRGRKGLLYLLLKGGGNYLNVIKNRLLLSIERSL